MARKQFRNIVEEKVENIAEEKSNKIRKGMLFSRLNYAAKYIYNNEVCMITARGKIKVDNIDLVEQPLSPGLLLREID